jgi:hypothetical protein
MLQPQGAVNALALLQPTWRCWPSALSAEIATTIKMSLRTAVIRGIDLEMKG